MVNGDVAPLFVLSLIERLPEGSKTFALMQDKEYWRAYQDITPDYYVLAAIVNAINTNTGARGNFKKPPKFDPFPLPEILARKARKKAKQKPRTLEDLHRMFTRGRR